MRTIIICLVLTMSLISVGAGAAAPVEKSGGKTSEKVSRAAFNQQVLNTKVTLQFDEAPIDDVLLKLSKEHETQFKLDPKLFELNPDLGTKFSVKASLKELPLRTALEHLFKEHKLLPVVVGDTIYLSEADERLPNQLSQHITVRYDKMPLGKVIEDLRAAHQIDVRLDSHSKYNAVVDLPIVLDRTHVTLQEVLETLAESAGLNFRSYPDDTYCLLSLESYEERRTKYLIERLNAPIVKVEKGEVNLPFLCEVLSSLASDPPSAKDPEKKLPILINVEAFKLVREGIFDPDRIQIRFSVDFDKFSFASVLKVICDQLDAAYLIRRDCIEIVPRSVAAKELNIDLGENQAFPVLANIILQKTPLEKAVRQLNDRCNQNIVLSPLAESKKDVAISARLVNAPIDAAVETIASMADLKVVRKANVYYVTTREQADELLKEQSKSTMPAVLEKKMP